MGNTSSQRKRYIKENSSSITKDDIGNKEHVACPILPKELNNVPAMSIFSTLEQSYLCAYDNGDILYYDWKKKIVLQHYHQAHKKTINQIIPAKAEEHRNRFFSCSRDLNIAQWELGKEHAIQNFSKHELTVTAVDCNADDTKLFSGGRDTTICVWDVHTGKSIASNRISQNLVTFAKWFPNDEVLIAQGSEDLSVKLWDIRCLSTSAPAASLEGYVYFPLGGDISYDGNYILTSSKGFNGIGCEGKIWDRRKNQVIQEFHGHQQDAIACRFLPSSYTDIEIGLPNAVTVSRDSTIKIWDGQNGHLLIDHFEISSRAFTSVIVEKTLIKNEYIIYATSFSGKVFIYSIRKKVGVFTLENLERIE